jgi:hypothetical protein
MLRPWPELLTVAKIHAGKAVRRVHASHFDSARDARARRIEERKEMVRPP